ncbi:MAG: hypothetical protein AABZ39_10840 [Spirochaetota bacterium]
MTMTHLGSWIIFVLTFVLAVSPAHSAASQNLIKNGDFETPCSDIGGIVGTWTPWGLPAGKDPSFYVVDTERPHGGKQSARISRTSKEPSVWDTVLASNPKDNPFFIGYAKRYTITFWARSAASGRSVLGILSYASVDPFRNGPLGMNIPFDTDTEWKEYSFTASYGKDFFIASNEQWFGYLGFFLSPNGASNARTLWIDDVRVAASDMADAGRFINFATLAYEALPLRLTSGSAVDIRINAAERIRRANKKVGGIAQASFGRWGEKPGYPFNLTNGEYTLSKAIENATRELQLPVTRFYDIAADNPSASAHSEPFKTFEEALDKAAWYLKRIGVAEETTTMELDDVFAVKRLPPGEWARVVSYSAAKGYRFQQWEIGNEPFVRNRPCPIGTYGSAYSNGADYADHVVAVSKAIKAVQPNAKIGLAIEFCLSPDRLIEWGVEVMQRAAGHYDFVAPHGYDAGINTALTGDAQLSEYERGILEGNDRILTIARKINALAALNNPGRTVKQIETEWGLHQATDKKNQNQMELNANMVGTLYRAVRLLYYAREETVSESSAWNLFGSSRWSTGFAALYPEAPEKRSMLYWLYYYFNRHVGDWVVAMSGTSPTHRSPDARDLPRVPCLASVSDDEKRLFLMLVNSSMKNSADASISVNGFKLSSSSIEAVSLTHAEVNGSPVLSTKEEFVHPLTVVERDGSLVFTMPSKSVAFITVTTR